MGSIGAALPTPAPVGTPAVSVPTLLLVAVDASFDEEVTAGGATPLLCRSRSLAASAATVAAAAAVVGVVTVAANAAAAADRGDSVDENAAGACVPEPLLLSPAGADPATAGKAAAGGGPAALPNEPNAC